MGNNVGGRLGSGVGDRDARNDVGTWEGEEEGYAEDDKVGDNDVRA